MPTDILGSSSLGARLLLDLFSLIYLQLKCTFQLFNQALGGLETAREVAAWSESISSEKKRRLLRNLHTARGARVAFVDLSAHIGDSLYHRHRANADIIFPFYYVSPK